MLDKPYTSFKDHITSSWTFIRNRYVIMDIPNNFFSEYVGSWARDDDPMTEHRAIFPHCPFIRDPVAVGNVPSDLSADRVADLLDPDLAPTNSLDYVPSSSTARSTRDVQSSDETGLRPPRFRDLNSGPERSESLLLLRICTFHLFPLIFLSCFE